jgi:predicted nucleotidyltransferase
MPSPWAITAEKVQTAVKTIAEAYRPTRIIIFGSYTAGNVHAHSDLDLLIVSREHVSNPRQESV